MVMMELIGDLLPPGVVNIVSGYGLKLGNQKSRKQLLELIMQYPKYNSNHIQKSPNEDIMDKMILGKVLLVQFKNVVQVEHWLLSMINLWKDALKELKQLFKTIH